MLEWANNILATYRLGDWPGLVGLVITFVGFALTLRNVGRSRRAAEEARVAVEQLRTLIERENVLSDFSAAVAIMDEIRRLHRAHQWNPLPDRYSTLKRLLIAIRSANVAISEDQRTTIQGAILNFTNMERQIEEVIANPGLTPNVPRLNRIMSVQIDSLSAVLVAIRDQRGR